MRWSLSCILFLVVSLLWPGGLWAQVVYTDPSTGIEFPDRLGGLEYYHFEQYDEPEWGLCLRYQKPGIWADVFIYDLGLKNIPDGADSEEVDYAYDQAKGEVMEMAKLGYYEFPEVVYEKIVPVKTGGGLLAARLACFDYYQNDQERQATPGNRRSFLYLLGYKKKFLKIRFTYLRDQINNGDGGLDAFLQELDSRL